MLSASKMISIFAKILTKARKKISRPQRVKEIHSAYTKTAEDSMKATALELREMAVDNDDDNDGIGNVDVCLRYVAETWFCFLKWCSNCNRSCKWKMLGIRLHDKNMQAMPDTYEYETFIQIMYAQ